MTTDATLDGVYDFALRVVRDRGLAADVVRRAPADYIAARQLALTALKQRRRLARTAHHYREALDFTNVDTDRLSEPSAVIFDKDLIELVWDTAAALPPDEYSLLDLHVRQGLTANELGETDTRLARLRDAFDESVYATLLVTRSRRTCERLDIAFSDLKSEQVTPEVRRTAQQHIRGCRRCQETKSRFVSPLEIFASFAPMPVPAGLREGARRRFGRVRR